MMMDKNVPEIRFRGFNGEWAQRPFGDCFDNIPNNTLSRADLNYEYGIAKNVHYGDVLIKFGETLDASDITIPFITDENLVSKQKHAALKNGDVVIADAAEDSTVGKCTELFNIDEQVILSGLHTIAVRPTLPFASKYLGYYLNSSSYHDQLLPLMQGTKVLSISKTALKKTSVNFPSTNEEQTQIGNTFQKLDSLINQHQQKHDKLSNIKKAMLEKMFPKQGETIPEIRFKGFSGEWEEKVLGETRTYYTDGNYGEAYPSNSDLTDSSNGIPFLRGSNLSRGNLSKAGANYITKEKHAELTSGTLVEDDIVIAVRGSLGALGYVKNENVGWNINSQLAIIRTDKTELTGVFLIQYLLSSIGQWKILSKISGSALKQLPIGQLKSIAVPITSIEEQTAIGNYFQKLDALINQHQQQMTKLNNIKQACLSKMFI